IGADEYLEFPTWKEPEAVLELARLGVAQRPGFPLSRESPDRVLFFALEPVPVSSREIRALVARGEAIDGLVPPRVAAATARRRPSAARPGRSSPSTSTSCCTSSPRRRGRTTPSRICGAMCRRFRSRPYRPSWPIRQRTWVLTPSQKGSIAEAGRYTAK